MESFKRIGFALAFSPTAEALLAETSRMCDLFHAELILIHVGPPGPQEKELIDAFVQKTELKNRPFQLVWEAGDPAETILRICQLQQIDLLVAGALRKEKLVKYYVGTIARKIMRKANCSLMMIIQPSLEEVPIKNIVVNAEDSPFVEDALQAACFLGKLGKDAWLHVVREIKLYGLAMSSADRHSEEEYSEVKQQLLQDEIDQVDRMMAKIPHEEVKINVKMLSGKSGFELCKFADKKQADWLVVGAPPRRFKLLDRVFPHDLEYVFADLPCNLLIVQRRKEVTGG